MENNSSVGGGESPLIVSSQEVLLDPLTELISASDGPVDPSGDPS
jgi:hypothetical protein